MMIKPDAVSVGHVSPYKRIDITHPGRKAVITRAEVMQSGGREPDPAAYAYNVVLQVWTLKEGI